MFHFFSVFSVAPLLLASLSLYVEEVSVPALLVSRFFFFQDPRIDRVLP